jgi:hypothetical protein
MRERRDEERLNRARASPTSPTSPVARVQRVLTTVTITNADIKEVESSEFDNKMIMGEINEMFKGPSNSIMRKLKSKYNEYNRELDSNKRKEFYNHMQKKYELSFNGDEPIANIRNNIKNYVGHSIPSLFARYLLNGKDMKFNDLDKYMVINLSINIDDAGNVSIVRQSGIDVGGLRRDFVTALTTELFKPNNGIFITREGTKKYFLNPNFVFDNYYKQIIGTENIGYDFDVNFKEDFYTFLGKLISFILVNDCGLEHNLSSYLVASLYKDPRTFTGADYVYFMMDDFPEYFKSIVNLLKMNPEEIEYVSIGFNDYFNLDRDNSKELNKDNIEEYLYKCSEFMMTQTILRKDIDNISGGTAYNRVANYGKEIHQLFINGIVENIRNYLIESKVPLSAVNSYLIKPTMSQEIIDKLILNFNNTMLGLIGGRNREYLTKMKDIFIDYILKYRVDKYQLSGNTSNDRMVGKEKYFKFIDNLLRFWSGSSFYKSNESYKIQINENLSVEHLPQSHTCFFTIDLPKYTGTNDKEIGDKLYNKIEMAITNAETGIGLAGGKPKKRRSLKKKI